MNNTMKSYDLPKKRKSEQSNCSTPPMIQQKLILDDTAMKYLEMIEKNRLKDSKNFENRLDEMSSLNNELNKKVNRLYSQNELLKKALADSLKAVERTVSEIVQETTEKSLEDYFNLRQLDKWREKHSKILEKHTKEIKKDLTLQTRLTFFGNFLYPTIGFMFLTGVFMNIFWEWFLLLHWGWWVVSGIIFLGIITLIFIGVKRWKGLPTRVR